MSWLRRDDGAVAVLVAVVMVVFMGFGALVLDVGSWYAEGRQLQNGAQAGAFAVAQGCVTDGICDSSTLPSGRAGTYAGDNANDGNTTVTEVCGNAPGLGGCSTPAQRDLYDCRGVPSPSTLFVQVRTETLTAAGTDEMPPLLLNAFLGLLGNAPDSGKTVTACARASWGGPAALTADIPLVISYCEFAHYMGDPPTGFGPTPPEPLSPLTAPDPGFAGYAGDDPGDEHVFFLKYSDTDTTAVETSCGTDAKNGPGAFGWLFADDCEVESTAEGTFPSDPGASPTNCSAADIRAMVGQELALPVYAEYYDKGTKTYRIQGFASFVLTGFYLQPGGGKDKYSQKSIVTGAFPCGTSPTYKEERCISGFFTEQFTPVDAAVGGPMLGVTTTVQITG